MFYLISNLNEASILLSFACSLSIRLMTSPSLRFCISFTSKYSSASKPSTLSFLSLNFSFLCALSASSSSFSVSLTTSLIEEGAFSKMWHLCSFTTSVAFFSGILPPVANTQERKKKVMHKNF